jgi:hypothetical protein
MAMITDARNQPWPLDIRIDHQSQGLKMPSVVRMKFFTLDIRFGCESNDPDVLASDVTHVRLVERDPRFPS